MQTKARFRLSEPAHH